MGTAWRLILLPFVAALCGCGVSRPLQRPAEEAGEVQGFSCRIDPRAYPATADSVRLSIWNDTRTKLRTTSECTIERLDGEAWTEIQPVYEKIKRYALKPGGERWFSIPLRRECDYKPGRYRVLKHVIFDGDDYIFDIAAEFTLE